MTRNFSILVVDDNTAMRGVLSALLLAEGHTLVDAANGSEGLEAIQQHPIDIILTDILMPDKDGLKFIEEIRGTHPFVPIIAFSGGGQWLKGDYCLTAARSIGATVVLSKPFDRQQLMEAIDEAVNPTEEDTRRLNNLLLARHEFASPHDRMAG
jgi:CheY-like chemotaxis protein